MVKKNSMQWQSYYPDINNSHIAERVLHMQASLTFNQLENTTLQFKQLNLM